MLQPLECASVTSSSSALQTDCSVHCWKTQGNGKQTEKSTSLVHCTFQANSHDKIQSFVQGRSSFPYPPRCSFARPTLVAVDFQARQGDDYATSVRPTRCLKPIGDSGARSADCKRHAFGFESKFEYILHIPDARSVLGPKLQTVKSNEANERFMCDNMWMNASRISRAGRDSAGWPRHILPDVVSRLHFVAGPRYPNVIVQTDRLCCQMRSQSCCRPDCSV